MPYGTELLLVLNRDTVRDYALRYLDDTADGAKAVEEFNNREFIADGYDEDPSEWNQVACDYMNALIEWDLWRANADLLRSRFTNVYPTTKRHGGRYFEADLPDGERVEFASLSVGYHSVEDGPITYGISLWGRYFRTWLDWDIPGGGSGSSLILDVGMTEMIGAARNAIAPVVPEIATAPLGFVMQWY